MTSPLTWTRREAGVYQAGPWVVSRIDRLYRPLWLLTHDDGTTLRCKTLHQAQVFAAHLATTMPLFARAAPLE